MATAQRPTAVASTPEPGGALTLYKKPELAAFTTANAKALLMPKLAPLGITFEHLLTELYFAMQKTPALAKCSPASLVQSAVRCLEWGLTIGEKAFMVPFKGTATAVRSYQGDIELIVRAGGARSIDASAVYDGDHFEYQLGSNAFINHRPSSKSKTGRKITHGYSVAHIAAGIPPKVVVLTIEEIDAIRKSKSQSWWAEKDREGNIKRLIPIEEIPWYVEKTPVHKIAKQLPTSPRMAKVVAQFDEEVVTDAVIEDAEPTTGGEEPGAGVGAPASAADTGTAAPSSPAAPVIAKCPKCGSADMYDNREENVKRRAAGQRSRPDFKCKDEACGGLIWPPKDNAQMQF
jgi:phage RecT family recombinase